MKITEKDVFFNTKSTFLNPILSFFQKNEFIHRKTSQMNIFPGGIKKSANIGQKIKGQAHFGQKRVKKGLFFGKKYFSERKFTFFEKNRVHSGKDSPNEHIPWRN